MHAAAPELQTPAPELIPPAPELRTPAPELIPPTPPSAPAPTRTRFLEVQLRAIRVPAIITLMLFALSLSGMKYAAVSREQEIPITPAPGSIVQTTEPTPAPAPPTPAPAAEPEPESGPEPLHFRNPFDAAEVFDFPAGTSQDEARAAVAAILLERARSRAASAR
jgi:hypothetical protein